MPRGGWAASFINLMLCIQVNGGCAHVMASE